MNPIVWPLLTVSAAFVASGLRVVKEWERGVCFRLGKYSGTVQPGLVFLTPIVDTMQVVDLRELVLDFKAQEAITKDNVTLKVNAVVFFRVTQPELATMQILDYNNAIVQVTQTTLRSIIGQHELDCILSERDKLHTDLQTIINRETERWGIQVTHVEIKDLELPPGMQRAMAKQAEAEREKRAKIVHAEGELQAAHALSEAAQQLSSPEALQLRYLQTLTEIAVENSSTLVFPVPIDTLKTFMNPALPVTNGKAIAH